MANLDGFQQARKANEKYAREQELRKGLKYGFPPRLPQPDATPRRAERVPSSAVRTILVTISVAIVGVVLMGLVAGFISLFVG
jgi:hypothetical protein